tara:strand:- start:726 stop:1223 length:498 start_codon:yes stop_codon:yes gene_type:complete
MAIVSSGAVSLSDIATEFGGSAPHSLSEYYGDGNAPSSGEIQLAEDFYGTSSSIATGTVNVGSRYIKSGTTQYGFSQGSTTGGASFGSLSTYSMSGTSTQIYGLYIQAGFSPFFMFAFSHSFTGWTSISINNGANVFNRTSASTSNNRDFHFSGSFQTPTSFVVS